MPFFSQNCRSECGGLWLVALMPNPARKSLHPLLMEPTYWRNRVEEMNLRQRSLFVLPRPDLSSPAVDVAEIRLRAHDGLRLVGITGRCTLGSKAMPVRIRMICADQPLEVDREAVCDGFCDIAIHVPNNRRLEDRVLDVMRACQTAAEMDGVDPGRISFVFRSDDSEPDELRIASQLLSHGLEF